MHELLMAVSFVSMVMAPCIVALHNCALENEADEA